MNRKRREKKVKEEKARRRKKETGLQADRADKPSQSHQALKVGKRGLKREKARNNLKMMVRIPIPMMKKKMLTSQRVAKRVRRSQRKKIKNQNKRNKRNQRKRKRRRKINLMKKMVTVMMKKITVRKLNQLNQLKLRFKKRPNQKLKTNNFL